MDRRFLRFLQVSFVLLDWAVLDLSFLFAETLFNADAASRHFDRYSQDWFVMNTFWLIAWVMSEVYQEQNISYFNCFMQKTARAFTLWATFVLVYVFLPGFTPLSLTLNLTTTVFFLGGLLLNRFLYVVIREWVKRRIYLEKKVLIVGYNKLAMKLAAYLDREGLGIKVMGYVDDKAKTGDSKYPIFANIAETVRISKQLRVNEVYSTIMPENNAKVYNLMQQADRELIRFRIVPDFCHLVDRPVHIDFFHDIPIFSVRREPLEDVLNRTRKRVFDVVVSSLVTVFILSWLIPLLGLLIRLESKGPVFFAQIRSGRNNKPFRCYKFRSMAANKEANSVQATKNDKRVTRVGRFIRKTSLDEFPQFWNVLKGEMSIVGPRPHMLKHTREFSKVAEEYMIRQYLKPGITGWAQVNGYRGEITAPEHIQKRVEHDLWYLENWSVWLDIRIMFLTVYNVFKGEENAY